VGVAVSILPSVYYRVSLTYLSQKLQRATPSISQDVIIRIILTSSSSSSATRGPSSRHTDNRRIGPISGVAYVFAAVDDMFVISFAECF